MIVVIQTTSDTPEELDILSHDLVEGRLAACGQVEGPITSTYVWDEEVKDAEEYRLTLKTTTAQAEQAVAYIVEHHSYDNPEVIRFEVQASPAYEAWVVKETS